MANKSYTTADFIKKANQIHNNKYNYEKTEFTSSRDKLIITCPEHGDFEQRASAHIDGQSCKKCRNKGVGERFLDTKEDFIQKANKKHGNKYDYSKVDYITNKIKVIIVCPEHGDFEQTPGHHKRGTCCPLCALASLKRRSTLEKFIAKSKQIHGDSFDYSETKYNHSHEYVKIICNNCNKSFEQIAYSHVNIGNGCPHCLSSKREFELKEFIRDELGLVIVENSRSIISPKEIDIFIPEKNFAIEYNGTYHHSELMGTDKHYHLQKTNACETKGIRLLHIFENEWKMKKDLLKSIVRNKLGLSQNRIFARKCVIKEISTKEKNIFLDHNHIQGQDQSRIKLGLFFNEQLVSVMTFGVPRYDKKCQWELIRFASLRNTVVIGGADKLFKYFIKHHNPSTIISYADRRYSDGNLYEKLHFELSHISDPRYWYMKKNNYLLLFHRSNFTKDKIKQKYPEVDLSKDEWTLMQELGYNRIWDCGTKVYIWTKHTM